jgi:glyoxylase I family protein
MANTNPTIHGGGLHHVALRVTDWERSLKFYCEGLGFVKKCAWTMGNGTLAAMLDTGDGNYLELFSNGAGEDPAEARLAHFALRTESVDAAHGRALEAGATERVAPTDVPIADEVSGQPVPVRLSFVYGPDGEIIEFMQGEIL